MNRPNFLKTLLTAMTWPLVKTQAVKQPPAVTTNDTRQAVYGLSPGEIVYLSDTDAGLIPYDIPTVKIVSGERT